MGARNSRLAVCGRCSADAARGLEVSPGGLLKDKLVERQVGDRPAKPQVLLLQILHLPRLIRLQTALLLAPAVISLLADRDPTTRIRRRPAPRQDNLSLTQRADNLFRPVPLAHFLSPAWSTLNIIDGPLRRVHINLGSGAGRGTASRRGRSPLDLFPIRHYTVNAGTLTEVARP